MRSAGSSCTLKLIRPRKSSLRLPTRQPNTADIGSISRFSNRGQGRTGALGHGLCFVPHRVVVWEEFESYCDEIARRLVIGGLTQVRMNTINLVANRY